MKEMPFVVRKLLADPEELSAWAMVEYFVQVGSATFADVVRWNSLTNADREYYAAQLIARVTAAADH